MRFLKLQKSIKSNLFTIEDVVKYFPNDNPITLRTQLSRLTNKKLISRIKRGLYCFDPQKIDELQLANILYLPSYVSVETALNYYGIIPDVPQGITSVTTVTSKKIQTIFGVYHYLKIDPKLFFGFNIIKSQEGYLKIAKKEKALLDFFYLRKIKNTADLRLNLKNIDRSLYEKYIKNFPSWVKKIRL